MRQDIKGEAIVMPEDPSSMPHLAPENQVGCVSHGLYPLQRQEHDERTGPGL